MRRSVSSALIGLLRAASYKELNDIRTKGFRSRACLDPNRKFNVALTGTVLRHVMGTRGVVIAGGQGSAPPVLAGNSYFAALFKPQRQRAEWAVRVGDVELLDHVNEEAVGIEGNVERLLSFENRNHPLHDAYGHFTLKLFVAVPFPHWVSLGVGAGGTIHFGYKTVPERIQTQELVLQLMSQSRGRTARKIAGEGRYIVQ